MKNIAYAYLRSYFVFDLLSCMPTLITGNRLKFFYYFKALKFLKLSRTQLQFNIIESAVGNRILSKRFIVRNVF